MGGKPGQEKLPEKREVGERKGGEGPSFFPWTANWVVCVIAVPL